MRQGVRCRDCSISCHKHCKDHVVVDCNRRKARKCKHLFICSLHTLSPTAKKTDSVVEGGTDTELYLPADSLLRERLQRAEEVSLSYGLHQPIFLLQARDAYAQENAELQAQLAEANAKIQELQAHISMIRQHTIGFILEQMSTAGPTTSDV